MRQTALESARLETKMLDEVWRFYSDEISDIDPQTSNITITENYRHVHPSLPLPATFAIDLGERISRRSPGMEVRVFSRYPWPTRKDGGPQGEIDVAALEWLEAQAKPTRRSAGRVRAFRRRGRASASCSTTRPATWRRAASPATTIPTASALRKTGKRVRSSAC